VNPKLKSEQLDRLFEAILTLSSVDECYDFFEDLCTVSELKAFPQRFQVAELLNEGRVYNEIVRTTGASTATISRVGRALNFGTNGYKTIIDKMKEAE